MRPLIFVLVLLTPSLAFACRPVTVATYAGDFLLVGALLTAGLCFHFRERMAPTMSIVGIAAIASLAASFVFGVFVAKDVALFKITYYGLVAVLMTGVSLGALKLAPVARKRLLGVTLLVLTMHTVSLVYDHSVLQFDHCLQTPAKPPNITF